MLLVPFLAFSVIIISVSAGTSTPGRLLAGRSLKQLEAIANDTILLSLKDIKSLQGLPYINLTQLLGPNPNATSSGNYSNTTSNQKVPPSASSNATGMVTMKVHAVKTVLPRNTATYTSTRTRTVYIQLLYCTIPYHMLRESEHIRGLLPSTTIVCNQPRRALDWMELDS